MITYPHTIDNGHGEQLTFLGRIVKDNIECLEVENSVAPGCGPPMHVHFRQTESITVTEGRMAAQLKGKEPVYLSPGEYISFPPGVMHRFWNAGDTMLRCKGVVWPPDNLEYFLTEIFRSTKANGGRPSPFDAAYLLNRYKDEFDMELPAPVKKVVFPVLRFVGRTFGIHKKFRQQSVGHMPL